MTGILWRRQWHTTGGGGWIATALLALSPQGLEKVVLLLLEHDWLLMPHFRSLENFTEWPTQSLRCHCLESVRFILLFFVPQFMGNYFIRAFFVLVTLFFQWWEQKIEKYQVLVAWSIALPVYWSRYAFVRGYSISLSIFEICRSSESEILKIFTLQDFTK